MHSNSLHNWLTSNIQIGSPLILFSFKTDKNEGAHAIIMFL